MQFAASAAGTPHLAIHRAGPNDWRLTVGSGDGETCARLELDACGAWLTVTNAEAARPVVVRRAGWVDVRGHPFFTGKRLVEDRVGLGPGDALVVARPPNNDTTTDAFLDCLLAAPGEAAALCEATVVACGSDEASVTVLRVPEDLGANPRQRVADATGIAVDDLTLPGYPLGDVQPELWSEPPRPPRMARLRLRADTHSVRTVRDLLDRLVASWRLSERVDHEGLKLAASELATNAVSHTGEPECATVRYLGDVVRVEVDDRSSVAPEMRNSPLDQVGGRGLRVVDAVASSWGVEPRPSGKRVWCEIGVKPA